MELSHRPAGAQSGLAGERLARAGRAGLRGPAHPDHGGFRPARRRPPLRDAQRAPGTDQRPARRRSPRPRAQRGPPALRPGRRGALPRGPAHRQPAGRPAVLRRGARHRRRPAALARERLPGARRDRGHGRRRRAGVGGDRPGRGRAATRADARPARRAHPAGADRHRLPRSQAALRAHQREPGRRERAVRRGAPRPSAARGGPRDRPPAGAPARGGAQHRPADHRRPARDAAHAGRAGPSPVLADQLLPGAFTGSPVLLPKVSASSSPTRPSASRRSANGPACTRPSGPARAAAERAQARLDLLARASDLLGRSLDERDVLAQLARLLVPDLADWLVVLLPDGRGRHHPGCRCTPMPPRRPWPTREAVGGPAALPIASDVPAAAVFRTGRPLHTADIRPYLLTPGTPASVEALADVLAPSPGLLVPMVVRGRVGRRAVPGQHHRARPTPWAPTSSSSPTWLGAPASPSTTPGCSASAPGSPRACSRACCPSGCRPCPASRSPSGTRPPKRRWTSAATSTTSSRLVRREHLVLVGDVSGRGVDAATVTGLARHTLRAFAHELSPAPGCPAGAVLHAQERRRAVRHRGGGRLTLLGDGRAEVTLAARPATPTRCSSAPARPR